jgi:hypothetical protein
MAGSNITGSGSSSNVNAPSFLQVSAAESIRAFLTRRSVSTLGYYLREFHDSASLTWLNEFLARADQDSFDDNGTSGFISSMLVSPPVTCTMTYGHKNLKRSFKFDIRPMDLAYRLLACRVQLSEEWSHDLACIILENKEILRMSIERMAETDERKLNSVRSRVYDYDNASSEQTPLRYKNYHKLKLLATQHACARLELFLRDTNNHDYMFFRSYRLRATPIKSDEDFILGLLKLVPVSRINPSHEINPAALAKQLMDMRAHIAEEWIQCMVGIPVDHMKWSRQRLEASMSMNLTRGEDLPASS